MSANKICLHSAYLTREEMVAERDCLINRNKQLEERNALLEKEFQRIARDYDDILINKNLLENPCKE